MKLIFKVFILGALFGSLVFVYKRTGSSQTTTVRVVVAEQPGVPLVILATFVDSANPLKPRYGYSISNVVNKTILAYAVEETTSLQSGLKVTTTTLTHLPAKRMLLGPGASRQEEGGGKNYDAAATQVGLSIDFVEFTDGTRWGEDNAKSGERLDGERAGARVALRNYRELMSTNGINKLIERLEGQFPIEAEDRTKSSNWLSGFSTGAVIVRKRLLAAKSRGGPFEVEKELNKPYDATEGHGNL